MVQQCRINDTIMASHYQSTGGFCLSLEKSLSCGSKRLLARSVDYPKYSMY